MDKVVGMPTQVIVCRIFFDGADRKSFLAASLYKTASSMKSEARAAESFLLNASSYFIVNARICWAICGSTVSFCWAKVGKTKPIARPTKRVFEKLTSVLKER